MVCHEAKEVCYLSSGIDKGAHVVFISQNSDYFGDHPLVGVKDGVVSCYLDVSDFGDYAKEYTLEQLRELAANKKAEEWPDEDCKRQQAVGQNGNDGAAYEQEPERMTGGLSDAGKIESVGMKDKYPKYYKDVSGLNAIDVYQIHSLFDVQDASGCLQHASKKLLLSGVRTGGKSKHDDIREARDTLTRWLDINSTQ